jgi:2-keto-4-pentenoate hydratase/2-oxohepta-3-ene-1,7-dioic acid hydratase in catechol pathway
MLHPALRAEREAVAALFAGSVARLEELRPLAGQSADIEALHDFRVELRRLRTVLRAHDGAMPVSGIARLVEECRWLAASGSGLRDADVLQHRLGEYLNAVETDPQSRHALERAVAGLRSGERRTTLRSIRSRRAERLVSDLRALLDLPVAGPGWSARPCLARAIRKGLARFAVIGGAIDVTTPPEALHELRKRCKRLRYLLEVYRHIAPGKDVDSVLRRLRKLQNELGEFQDLETHMRLLGGLCERLADTPAGAGLRTNLLDGIAVRAAAVRQRALRRFADFASSKSLRRLGVDLKHRTRLAHPLVGTAGYCHGFVSGELARLPVGKIVCVGRNYAAHAAELGNPVPERPLLFVKPPSAAVDFEPVLCIPTDAGSVHHEIEIALLVGRELKDATPEQAQAAIAGIGLGLDLTLRELQDVLKAKGHPWEIAKGFDGACALGPFVPPDPALDLGALELRLSVNGRRRQAGSSAQMLTPILALLCLASRHFSLWPGDVLLTGTPSGVGPLKPGDRLTAELVGLSRLRTVVS